MDKIVTFRSYFDLTKAELAKTKLEDNNIPCFLTDVHINGLYAGASMFTGGVKLNIFEKDYQRVFEALIEDFELDKDALGAAVKCPNCHSYHIRDLNNDASFNYNPIYLLKFIFPALGQDHQFICQDCSTSFQSDK